MKGLEGSLDTSLWFFSPNFSALEQSMLHVTDNGVSRVRFTCAVEKWEFRLDSIKDLLQKGLECSWDTCSWFLSQTSILYSSGFLLLHDSR